MNVVWPFATKDPSQYQRVDEGWDIQSEPGAAIVAIGSGTVHTVNRDPGGFGNDYWSLELDTSIGGPTNWVYNGHCHLELPDGTHVVAGQRCGHANHYDGENGSGAPPGWLEIGFARPGTGSPVNQGAGTTPAGQTMKDILINASVGGGGGTHHNAGAQMLIRDKSNGNIWLLGPGKAYHVPSMGDVDRLRYIGVADAGDSDPLVVISWMKTFGAWG